MVIVNLFIIISACLPSDPSTKESGLIVNISKGIINTFKPDTINESNIGSFTGFIRKFIGHFSVFVFSGFLTTLSVKFIYYNFARKFILFVIFSSISGLFFAFLSEFIQLFVPGRSGEITDVLIDFSGYCIGLLIIVLITYIKEKKSSSMENNK